MSQGRARARQRSVGGWAIELAGVFQFESELILTTIVLVLVASLSSWKESESQFAAWS